MTMLGEIPFDEIKVGTIVEGLISDGEVIAVGKNPRYKEWDQDGWEVTIRWSASGRVVPYIWYWMLDKVKIKE